MIINDKTPPAPPTDPLVGLNSFRPPAKLGLTMASMGQPETNVAALCKELDITRQTLYGHVSPTGELREDGRKLLAGGK